VRITRVPVVLLVVVIGLTTSFVSLGLLGLTPPAAAQEVELTGPINLAPRMQAPAPEIDYVIYYTYSEQLEITDLSGNVVGEGIHGGKLRCIGDNCNQRTEVVFTRVFAPLYRPDVEYDYRFASRQAHDPIAERVVVAGTGTLSSNGQKERFTFTATFENNRDGTVSATYVASRPDASFRIPNAPGTFEVSRRR